MALRAVCCFSKIFKRSAFRASSPDLVIVVFHPFKNGDAWIRLLLIDFHEVTDFCSHGFHFKIVSVGQAAVPVLR